MVNNMDMFWEWVRFIEWKKLLDSSCIGRKSWKKHSQGDRCFNRELCSILGSQRSHTSCLNQASLKLLLMVFLSSRLPAQELAAWLMKILWVLLTTSQLSAVKWEIHSNSLLPRETLWKRNCVCDVLKKGNSSVARPGKQLLIVPSDQGFRSVLWAKEGGLKSEEWPITHGLCIPILFLVRQKFHPNSMFCD